MDGTDETSAIIRPADEAGCADGPGAHGGEKASGAGPRDTEKAGSSAGRHSGERLVTTYPPLPASATRMRRSLRAYLTLHAVHPTVTADVVLAAEEAFINAVTHAAGGEILVSVTVSQDEACVEVRDGGAGFTVRHTHRHRMPDVRRPNGRGVFLIESLMDAVIVRSSRGGTTVRMVRRLA